MAKYKNKYRIESARHPNWDYGWDGSYYVTICTKNMKLYFGDIKNGEMNFTEIGKIAHQYFLEIPNHFPFVKLGEFIIMPNHIHGIIIIDKNSVQTQNLASQQNLASPQNIASQQNPISPQKFVPPSRPVQTQNIASLPQKTKNKFAPQSQNLGSIIRGFKTGVTVYAKKNKINFGWHVRFHDRIIRDNDEYNRIEQYIKDNPKNWDNDKFKK